MLTSRPHRLAAKRSVSDLAFFGGHPAFPEPLHVGRPHLPDRRTFLARVGGALDRRWLTNDGPLVRELEARLAEFLDVGHCVAVANGTLGLQLVLRALGVGGSVALPSFTFVATAHAASWMGLDVDFCDVDPATHNLDPNATSQRVGPGTGAIVGVHLWGRACAVEDLAAIADRHGVPLIFDAAHAIGCLHEGRPIGRLGAAEVFSFHATKSLSSLEGGAITTRDASLAKELRLLRNFGFTGYDAVATIGTNAKMNELCAAFGLGSLESFPQICEHNRRIWSAYRDELADLEGIELIAYDPPESNNHQYIVASIDSEAFGLDRDQLLELLHAEKALARRYFYPGVHRMPPYRDRGPQPALPVTEDLAARLLTLPSGGELSVDEVRAVCGLLRLCSHHSDEVAERLAHSTS